MAPLGAFHFSRQHPHALVDCGGLTLQGPNQESTIEKTVTGIHVIEWRMVRTTTEREHVGNALGKFARAHRSWLEGG